MSYGFCNCIQNLIIDTIRATGIPSFKTERVSGSFEKMILLSLKLGFNRVSDSIIMSKLESST